MRRASAAALLAGAGALVVLALAAERRTEASRMGAAAVASPAPLGAVDTEELGPLPPSLRGTEPPGDLRVDARGRFAPDPEALALFDYFLSARGEEPDAAIRARIVAEIRRRLPPAAAADAEALLGLYLAYRLQAAALGTGDAAGDPEALFQSLRALRTDVFGAALAEALFGEEERIVAIDLERHRVLEQTDLAPEERARRLAELEAELPPEEREAREATRAALDLREAEAALRAQGADDAAIRAERERRVGPEAADRLAALDARRAAWSARVSAYRAARDALAARGLPADAYAEELARLRDERFQGPERRRIEALDRIESQQAATGAAAAQR